ncbi:kelch-like protein 10 [Littorina saxatilis]|uniref:BTB domain-containing protein n=1 Tax=Littorina saxatilis TaxID=31220 RepID=A0AAN9BAQ5_9CAEN
MEVEQPIPSCLPGPTESQSRSSLKIKNVNEQNAALQRRVYKVLDELRQGGFFCDAVIRCGEHKFKVQRNILSTCSPYFTALFTYEGPGDNPKRNKVVKEFCIDDMAPEVMELLIKYAYTRDVPADPSAIIQLLPAADRFQMEGLLKACCQALVKEMTLDNCMQIRAFARAFPFSCRLLTDEADKFLLENFAWIYCFSAEFLQMDVDDLCNILGSDRLNARSEGITLDAVCRWIAYDLDNRQTHCERLLRQVRLGLLTNDAFFRILNYHKLTTASPAVHSVLLEASKMMGQPEVRATFSQCVPRLPTNLVFVFGGSHLGWPLQIVEALDIRSVTWKECSALEFGPRSYHGTAVLDRVVYVVGGFDGNDYTNYCTAFYPTSGQWIQVAPMHDKRCYVSVAVHDKHVYALGGFDGRTRQRSAEKFHPVSNQWTMIQPMLCPRSDGGAATLKDKIYIMGGFNGQESLNSVEYYDPVSFTCAEI